MAMFRCPVCGEWADNVCYDCLDLYREAIAGARIEPELKPYIAQYNHADWTKVQALKRQLCDGKLSEADYQAQRKSLIERLIAEYTGTAPHVKTPFELEKERIDKIRKMTFV